MKIADEFQVAIRNIGNLDYEYEYFELLMVKHNNYQDITVSDISINVTDENTELICSIKLMGKKEAEKFRDMLSFLINQIKE